MKKYNGSKVIIIIASICIVIGAMMLGAGLVQGGSLRYLNVSASTVSWWPFSHGNIGMGIFDIDDDSDILTSNDTHTLSLGNIKKVDINVDVAEIEIKRGNSNRIVYDTKHKDCIHVTEKDGVLLVSSDEHNHINMRKTDSIVIELKDELYEMVKINCDLGDVDIENIRAKEFDIDASLGDLDLEKVTSQNMKIIANCGDISVQGSLLGNTEIKNDLGDTDVEINGRESDYSYHLVTSLGDTEYNGNSVLGSANLSGGVSSAPNHISIANAVGDVELEIH